MIGVLRTLAHVWAVGLVLTGTACGSPPTQPESGREPATLAPATPEAGMCAPDRLVRCVPGLADFDDPIFDFVHVAARTRLFAALPSAFTSPEEGFCTELPRFGAHDDPELDVTYLPSDSARRGPGNHPFPAENTGNDVNVRLMVAQAGADVGAQLADWVRQCPSWAIAHTLEDHGTHGWLLAQSGDVLARYRSGDVAGQWRNVIQVAAAVLPNGLLVQTWYRTDDPSTESRNHVLSQIVDAVGRPRPRAALPPRLVDWNGAQLSGLLPQLALTVFVRAKDSEPGGFVALCPAAGGDPVPPYDTEATWNVTDPVSAPGVTINVPRPGVDYLAALRREITACGPRAHDVPDLCRDLPNNQFLQSDSAVADGEDTLRITHRWVGAEDVQRYARCVERIEALRITQVRGLLVISRYIEGGPKQRIGDEPVLPLRALDELQATTVQRIKAA